MLKLLNKRIVNLRKEYKRQYNILNTDVDISIEYKIYTTYLQLLCECIEEMEEDMNRLSKEHNSIILCNNIAKASALENKVSISNIELLQVLAQLHPHKHKKDLHTIKEFVQLLGPKVHDCEELNFYMYTLLACLRPFHFMNSEQEWNRSDIELINEIIKRKEPGLVKGDYSNYRIVNFKYSNHANLVKNFNHDNRQMDIKYIKLGTGHVVMMENQLVGFLLMGVEAEVNTIKCVQIYDIVCNVVDEEDRLKLKAKLLHRAIKKGYRYVYNEIDGYFREENQRLLELNHFEKTQENVWVRSPRKNTNLKAIDFEELEKEDEESEKKYYDNEIIQKLKLKQNNLRDRRADIIENLNALGDFERSEGGLLLKNDKVNIKEIERKLGVVKRELIKEKKKELKNHVPVYFSNEYKAPRKYKLKFELMKPDEENTIYMNLDHLKTEEMKICFVELLEDKYDLEIKYASPNIELHVAKNNLSRVNELFDFMGLSYISSSKDIKSIDITFDWKEGFRADWNHDRVSYTDNREIDRADDSDDSSSSSSSSDDESDVRLEGEQTGFLIDDEQFTGNILKFLNNIYKKEEKFVKDEPKFDFKKYAVQFINFAITNKIKDHKQLELAKKILDVINNSEVFNLNEMLVNNVYSFIFDIAGFSDKMNNLKERAGKNTCIYPEIQNRLMEIIRGYNKNYASYFENDDKEDLKKFFKDEQNRIKYDSDEYRYHKDLVENTKNNASEIYNVFNASNYDEWEDYIKKYYNFDVFKKNIEELKNKTNNSTASSISDDVNSEDDITAIYGMNDEFENKSFYEIELLVRKEVEEEKNNNSEEKTKGPGIINKDKSKFDDYIIDEEDVIFKDKETKKDDITHDNNNQNLPPPDVTTVLINPIPQIKDTRSENQMLIENIKDIEEAKKLELKGFNQEEIKMYVDKVNKSILDLEDAIFTYFK